MGDLTDGYLEDIEMRLYKEQIEKAEQLVREAEERLLRVQAMRNSYFSYQYRSVDEVAMQKTANTHIAQ